MCRVGMAHALAAVRRLGAACFVAVLAGACNTLPAQGPDPRVVEAPRAADPGRLSYVVVDLTPAVVARVREARSPTLGQLLGDRRPAPDIRLGAGDVVGITIFEAAAGGLFIPTEAGARAGNFVSLPNQEVDQRGLVSVPYAGAIPAAGRTLGQVKAAIEERLRNRAIDPQAVVTLQDGRSSQVSVTGEVNNSVRFSVSRAGERVLDAIARAGGPKHPAYETFVTIKRGARSAKVYLNDIVSGQANDIYLQPGDTLVLSREFRSFMALGASGQNGQINFENETLTLAQALGRAGGVLDTRGDPGQTFLYRMEARGVVADLGYDVGASSGPTVPVIYRANLREPDGFFLASRFPMRDEDVLYVSNAPAAELAKVLALFQGALGSAADATIVRAAVRGGT